MNLDISIFDWGSQISAGVMEDYKLFIESTVLSAVHESGADEMTPVGGNENYSTYHVEIPADDVTQLQGNEYWVIVEYPDFDYTNEFGVINDAWEDSLAAFFRYDLFVYEESPCNNWVPVVGSLNGKENYIAAAKQQTGWTIQGDLFEDGDVGVAVNNGTSDIAFGTDVVWVDINTITFDIDLTDVPVGTYDIVVINGCGAQERGIGEDMLTVLKWIHVVGDPNIDVVTGYGTPKDIAIDPSSDRVAILYGNTWRRWTDEYETVSAAFYGWGNRDISYYDASPVHFLYGVDYYYTGNYYDYFSFTDWNGGGYGCWWFSQATKGMKDVANLQGGNELWGVFDWYNNIYWGPLVYFFRTSSPGTWQFPGFAQEPWVGGLGTSGVVMDNLRAIDMAEYPGSGLPDMYFLEYLPESDTGVIELWRVGYTPVYQNVSLGEGFLYDPLDITVDEAYNVYVLEENADGDPVIWAYDDTGALVGTSEPLSETDLSGDPLRLDCHLSKDPDEVHVLHTEGVTKFAM
jgi:hypothetical protein